MGPAIPAQICQRERPLTPAAHTVSNFPAPSAFFGNSLARNSIVLLWGVWMLAEKPTYEQLEQRLRKLEVEVQECERLSISNRYAAAIMHEVNNPLEAITNLVYLLQQETLTPGARERLNLLQEQIAVITAVTRPSLAFYREHKTSRMVNMTTLIDSVHKLHSNRLQLAGIELHRRCPENAMCEVRGSELLQVLSNLILNAVDALMETHQGSHIHIRVRCCPDCVHLLVADDGPGIPDHLESRLFEAHATGKQTGSGLGLWISDRIIRNHRGWIRHRTSRTAGRSGTVFRIYLPCKTAA